MLLDLLYDLIRWERALTVVGAGDPGSALDRWLDGVDVSALSFADRAGCAEPVAADLTATYGDAREDWLAASNHRPPMHLRVNVARTSREALQAALAADGIATEPRGAHALVVTGRGNLLGHRTFRAGHFELQDHGSQQVAELVGTGRVLDLCAGAGGKSLALAALGAEVVATDVRQRALDELERRAQRAGTPVVVVPRDALQTCDKVLVDAPCSGTGVWRRHPEYRWRLEDEGVPTALQRALLEEAAGHVAADGELVYATCSALRMENEAVVERFCADHPAWRPVRSLRTAPHVDDADGLYAVALSRG